MPTDLSDRRSQRGPSCDDELAVVKAAAWAWYQHSATEAKPTCEFDLAKHNRGPRPSRYKLEAAAAVAGTTATHDHATKKPPSEPPSCPGSPAGAELSLLDGYEVERITRHLDRLILSSRGGSSGGRSRRAPPGGGKGADKVGGFWLRHAVGLCGSRAEVAEAAVLVGGRRSPCSPG